MEKKDFVKDGLETSIIVDIIKKIRKTIEGGGSMSYDEKVKALELEYASFIERYPMLFDMAARKETFDWTSFNYFLMMRQKIIDDEISSEKASVVIGQQWYDKYMNKEDPNKKRKV